MPTRSHSHDGGGDVLELNQREITDAAQTALDITGDLTFEAWVNPNANDLVDTAIIGGKALISGDQLSYQMSFDDSGAVCGFIISRDGTPGNAEIVSFAHGLSAGVWGHFVGVFDAAAQELRLYKNGLLVAGPVATTATAIFDSSADFVVGGRDGAPAGETWNGFISDVRVWSEARSAADILANYQLRIATATNLEASYFFDDDALDQTANDNDLSTVGSPTFAEGEVPGFEGGFHDEGIAGGIEGGPFNYFEGGFHDEGIAGGIEGGPLNYFEGGVVNPSAPEAVAVLPNRMRADDATLGRPVYWDSAIIDSLGDDYTGPGPLTDIVLSKDLGT